MCLARSFAILLRGRNADFFFVQPPLHRQRSDRLRGNGKGAEGGVDGLQYWNGNGHLSARRRLPTWGWLRSGLSRRPSLFSMSGLGAGFATRGISRDELRGSKKDSGLGKPKRTGRARRIAAVAHSRPRLISCSRCSPRAGWAGTGDGDIKKKKKKTASSFLPMAATSTTPRHLRTDAPALPADHLNRRRSRPGFSMAASLVQVERFARTHLQRQHPHELARPILGTLDTRCLGRDTKEG